MLGGRIPNYYYEDETLHYEEDGRIEYLKAHLPRVTTLAIHVYEIVTFIGVVSLICAFPHLSHLQVVLGDICFGETLDFGRKDLLRELRKLRLQTLEISAIAERCNDRFLCWIQEARSQGSNSEQRVDLRVDTITLNWSACCQTNSISMGEVVEDICKAIGPSPRHLRMVKIQGSHSHLMTDRCKYLQERHYISINSSNLPLDLSKGDIGPLIRSFSQLRTLYIEVSMLSNIVVRPSPWIAQLISAITSPHFHKLTLKLILSKIFQLTNLCLSILDDALDLMIQRVDEMRIVLSPFHRMSVAFRDIVGFVNEQMPKTAARDIINFTYVDDLEV